MKVGINGTGIVGTTIANQLLRNGHEVLIGSRIGMNSNLKEMICQFSGTASQGTFSDAAKFGSIIFHCVMGVHSLVAAKIAGPDRLKGKLIVDVTNPVDFSVGIPPKVSTWNEHSGGEMLQFVLPKSKVVKAFNTVPYEIICAPYKINNKNIDMFICGDDNNSKAELVEIIIKEFGWNRENIIDLGELKHSRSTEGLLPFFCSLAMNTGTFNNGIKVYRSKTKCDFPMKDFRS